MYYFWIVFGIFMFIAAMSVVLVIFIQDRRYLRKKTSEVFGKGLREEIEMEREDSLRRKKIFDEALQKAKSKDVTS